jgi:tetratricopeptide (TPR) repeat protein
MNAADKFSQYIDQARLAEKNRNYQGAIQLYTRAINLVPEKRDYYEVRIKDLNTTLNNLTELDEKYKQGDYKAAIKGYSELLKMPGSNSNYSNSDYYLGRAKCFDKMGQSTNSYNEQVKNYHEALKDYNKSLEYDNDNIEATQSRADLYKRMNGNADVNK